MKRFGTSLVLAPAGCGDHGSGGSVDLGAGDDLAVAGDAGG